MLITLLSLKGTNEVRYNFYLFVAGTVLESNAAFVYKIGCPRQGRFIESDFLNKSSVVITLNLV